MKCPYNETYECKEIDEWDSESDPNAENHPCLGCEFEEEESRECMTNKEWLATVSAQEWYLAVHWLFHEYGKRFDDTYLAVIAWLEEKHIERGKT